jgi:hypothetical protein
MDDLGNISIPGVKGVARLCRLVTLYERPLWDTNYSQFTVRLRSRVFLCRVRECRKTFHTAKAKTTGNRCRKSARYFIELKETRIEPAYEIREMFNTVQAKTTGACARNPRDLSTTRGKTTGLRSKKSARYPNGRLMTMFNAGLSTMLKSRMSYKWLCISVQAKCRGIFHHRSQSKDDGANARKVKFKNNFVLLMRSYLRRFYVWRF